MSGPARTSDTKKSKDQRPGFLRAAGEFLLIGFLGLVLTAASGLALVASTCGTLSSIIVHPPSQWFAECVRSSPVRLMIGRDIYAIPREYEIRILRVSGPAVNWSRPCQRDSDPPIKAEEFLIYLDADLTSPGRGDSHGSTPAKVYGSVKIYVRDAAAPRRSASDAYKSMEGHIGSKGVELTLLPQKFGFLAYEPSKRIGTFISLSGAVERLEPAPLLIDCHRPGQKSRRTCRTGYNRFSADTVASYRFYEGAHPIAGWRHLDHAVRRFVSRLRISAGGRDGG